MEECIASKLRSRLSNLSNRALINL